MEKIWLKQYPKDVPHTIDPDSCSSLVEMFDRLVEKYSHLPAFSNFNLKMTYQEMADNSHFFAAYLQQQLGLKKGDRIAIMIPNLLQYPICMLGALKAGLTIVNVNPLYKARELKFQLQDSGATTIIVLANFAEVVQEVIESTALKHVIVTRIGDMLGIKGKLINFALKYIKRKEPDWKFENAIMFNQALADGQKLKLEKVPMNNDDIAFLQYTGGTTGLPKGAVLTHRNMIANVLQCKAWVTPALNEGREKILGALPFYHIFALTVCCLCFMEFGSECVLVTNPRDINSLIKTLKQNKITILVGLNTLFNALLQHKDFSSLDFSALKLTVAGGMATQKIIAKEWQKVTGIPILEGYGLTEASPVVTINPVSLKKFSGSIGLPIPSTSVKICNDNGMEVSLGESGELWIHGPQVMKGYFHHLRETKAVLDAEGWLRTGDIARIDEQGFVYLIDRKKDMIIVSGFNVYPNEIEDVISSFEKVKEVGVVGVSHPETGESVKAYIVKKNPKLTEQEVINFCRKNLTGYKVPKIIEFVKELPKSNVGKVLRRKLKENNAPTVHAKEETTVH